MVDIAIVDYGMGNLRSVSKALEYVVPDATIAVTSDPAIVDQAQRVVVPGQGAMPNCMRELEARGLRDAVIKASECKPFLGICIGLQMLFGKSEEGDVEGLGILPGKVVHFSPADMVATNGQKLKVPHMGWNQVQQVTPHLLWDGVVDNARFYFVHSYYVEPESVAPVVAQSRYPFPFACAVARDNIFAVQFHPEKSHLAGLTLLKNFATWEPDLRS